MEVERQLPHFTVMNNHSATQPSGNNKPLGQKAEGRLTVDLLAEAERLNFSAKEIAELRRLYAIDLKTNPAAIRQNKG